MSDADRLLQATEAVDLATEAGTATAPPPKTYARFTDDGRIECVPFEDGPFHELREGYDRVSSVGHGR